MTAGSTAPPTPREAVNDARCPLRLEFHDYPGSLVVIEGLDGAGKSSLIEAMSGRLARNDVDVVLTRQPTAAARQSGLFYRYLYEPGGRDSIEYRALLGSMLSDRFQHVHEVLRPALARGSVVLCDRYLFTMVASMRARGYEEDWLIDACSLFPRPDISVLIDAPLDVLVERIRSRPTFRDSYVERALYGRLQEEFWLLADQGLLDRQDSSLHMPAEIAERVLAPIEMPGR